MIETITSTTYHDTDDPEQADKNHIEGYKEAEESSDGGHSSFVWIAQNKVIVNHVDGS